MSDPARLSLNPRYLWTAALPAALFAISALLIYYFSEPFDAPPAEAGEFDPYKAGAARVGVLAAMMLFIGACVASIGFFVCRWLLLDGSGRRLTLAAFAALVLGAISIQVVIPGHTGVNFAGRSIACFAAEHSLETPSPQRSAARPPIPSVAECRHPRFRKMEMLAFLQSICVVLAFSALVCGAISTVAERPRPVILRGDATRPTADAAADEPPSSREAPDGALSYWEHQSEALNASLYLGALLLATALLFINASLRWPAFVLPPMPSHEAYIGTLLSYYGFTFSVMLGSFYVPVALILSGKLKAKKIEPGESRLPAAFRGPLQALKITLAISSTAIAGALPELLDRIV